MDYLTLILFVAGTLLAMAQAVLGWFAKTLWDAVQSLKQELAVHKESIPKEYISKFDFSRDMGEIREMFREIRNSLNEKADK